MSARHVAARIQLVAALLHVGLPLTHAQTAPPSRGLDLAPLLQNSGRVGGEVFQHSTRLGGRAIQGAGQLGHGVGRQVGGAAGQVYDDVREGRLRWVIGPAKDAIATTPQLHTAARNTRNAIQHAREVRRQETSLRRFLPKPKGYKVQVPTTKLVARQFVTPFGPANVAMTVGLTFAGGMVVAAQDEDVTWKDAVRSVTDRSLWTAMLASGVGYAVASLVAAAFIPGGGTLFPVVAPMIVGTVGAIVGWIMGEQLGNGASLGEAWEALDFPSILGLSIGASLGLLTGVALGAAIGGPIGAVVATIGAIAGTLLFRKLGLQWGQAIAQRLGLGGDEDGDAEAGVSVGPAGVSTSAAKPVATTRDRAELYQRLVAALEEGDRERAATLHQAMGTAVPAAGDPTHPHPP